MRLTTGFTDQTKSPYNKKVSNEVTGRFIPSFFVHKLLKTAQEMLTFRSILVIFDASFDLNTIGYFM